jgi:regulator of sirC expression with transglutaminase-like and TPR domain
MRRADRRDLLVRLLANLKGVYLNKGDHRRALAAVERILLVIPMAPAENRSRGVLLARLGRHDEAVEQLEDYLQASRGAADAPRIGKMLRDLREGITPPEGLEGL